MALTDENGGNFNVSMPVQPMGGFGGGFGNMFEFPWLLTGQQGINANTNAGFNQAALSIGGRN